MFDGVSEYKKTRPASKDRSQHPAHRGHRAHRPDLVKDKPHDNKREEYPRAAIASRSQLRWRTKTLKCNKVEGERKLKTDVTELRPPRDPPRDEGDGRNQNGERRD